MSIFTAMKSCYGSSKAQIGIEAKEQAINDVTQRKDQARVQSTLGPAGAKCTALSIILSGVNK